MVHRVESRVTDANPATTVRDADTDPVVHHRDSGGQRHASTMTQPALFRIRMGRTQCHTFHPKHHPHPKPFPSKTIFIKNKKP